LLEQPTSEEIHRQIALLNILIACGEKAIEAFQASANPVDAEFLVELQRIVERSKDEAAALKESVA
jgi:hypothetical protein